MPTIPNSATASSPTSSSVRATRRARDGSIGSVGSTGSGPRTTKKGRRATKTPGPAVHDDLVQRDFSAPGPDLVWLTDITEHPTSEGKLYACAIKDVFSNRIVGYALWIA